MDRVVGEAFAIQGYNSRPFLYRGEVIYRLLLKTSAPIGAREVKLEIMTDQPTDATDGYFFVDLLLYDRRQTYDMYMNQVY